jgi:DNA-binding NtrC family response regulator
MPHMNGIETPATMKQQKPELAVIMITAYRDADNVVAVFRLGA